MTHRSAWIGVMAIMIGMAFGGGASGQQNPKGLAIQRTAKIVDRLTPLLPEEVLLQGGMLGERIDASEKDRLLRVDENDLLDAFERRNTPHQDWQGEHVGKFLHAAVLAWNYTHDPALKTKIDRIVARLLRTQEPDGYLGTYPFARRWTSWDVWVHKYDLLGLLTYYQFTRPESEASGPALSLPHRVYPNARGGAGQALNRAALATCRRIGDLLIRTFGPGRRDINRAGEHVGMAADSVLEPVVLLYRATADNRYLEFAHYIVSNYDAPGGPAILASLEKYRSVRRVANAKAYEMLSNFNGLLELYRATGDRRLLEDMRIAWADIVQNRLYITGSASSHETFQDDFHLPNTARANICETCVTVTWEQMNLQLLRLTGDPRFADQAERSIYNHLLAAQKPTGDDWAYYTPLEGVKPYDSATTCCHSSGPRGVALIPSFAFMTDQEGGLVIDLYNSGTATTHLKSGRIVVKMKTDYPLTGHIVITVHPEHREQRFPLRLRIPAWTTAAEVTINGRRAHPGTPGSYLTLDRAWRSGDVIILNMTLPNRLEIGTHENEGRAAALHGPLVLALDSSLNPGKPLKRLELGAATSKEFMLTPAQSRPGELIFHTSGSSSSMNGATLALTPYADAGQDGKSRFEIWIPLPGKAPVVSGPISLLSGDPMSASRRGNARGDISDDDFDTFVVTYNGDRADMDWFAVTHRAPIRIGRVLFAHGRTFHDGGWFDATAGKPQVQVQTAPGSEWQTVATLASYPDTTATDSMGMRRGQKFEAKFPPIVVVAVRILGRPAGGDTPAQAFSSCAELQAFAE